MYCPNCAAPIDGLKFCRACGTNVSQIPQAITGQLPVTQTAGFVETVRRHRPTRLAGGIRSLMMGLGFLFVAIYLIGPAGESWGVWMLIPAFALLGRGIATMFQYRHEHRYDDLPSQVTAMPSASNT